ncbi:hypothetical protein [Algoriphagus sp.]|uniref:hypothetical protein n=1 Tax=Algoriphagus sp. TaxID=1872435 RepID=UPI0025D62B72|nr:hypothetical protein [Algoriphagus sp.]
MDLGNIIYIVAVIGYFIYQLSKKKKSGDNEGPERELNEPSRPTTFEDLMREIREAQNPNRPQPAPKPRVQQRQVEEIKPEPVKKKWYEETADDEISYYDGAYEKAKTAGEKAVPISQLEFTDIGLKAYEKKVENGNRYAELLKNPQSIKDAIVLSEILNRKHF